MPHLFGKYVKQNVFLVRWMYLLVLIKTVLYAAITKWIKLKSEVMWWLALPKPTHIWNQLNVSTTKGHEYLMFCNHIQYSFKCFMNERTCVYFAHSHAQRTSAHGLQMECVKTRVYVIILNVYVCKVIKLSPPRTVGVAYAPYIKTEHVARRHYWSVHS